MLRVSGQISPLRLLEANIRILGEMAASGYDLRALRLHLGKHRRPSHPISTSGALLAAIVAEAMAKAMAGSPNQRKTAQRRLRRLDGYMEQAVRKVLATKKSAAREGC